MPLDIPDSKYDAEQLGLKEPILICTELNVLSTKIAL